MDTLEQILLIPLSYGLAVLAFYCGIKNTIKLLFYLFWLIASIRGGYIFFNTVYPELYSYDPINIALIFLINLIFISIGVIGIGSTSRNMFKILRRDSI